jgi:uncharacterized damage-inducible protein DinB
VCHFLNFLEDEVGFISRLSLSFQRGVFIQVNELDWRLFMSSLEIVRSMIEYHTAMTRRVWDSIDNITAEQFLADFDYSHGSIRALLIHLASTDRRWLAGLQNLPDAGHVAVEQYPDKEQARSFFEQVAEDLMKYVATLSEFELDQNPNNVPATRWQVMVHLVNHGTDHRATVLQKLQAFGAPTFDQDFILWLWKR